MLGLKPGKGVSIGFDASQMVSPTFVSNNDLIPVIIKPISPAFNSFISLALGVNTPTFSIIYSWLVYIIFIFIFLEILPSITLTRITTPR